MYKLLANKVRSYNQVLNNLENTGSIVNDTKELIGVSMSLPIDKLMTSKRRLLSPYYLVGEILLNSDYVRDVNAYEYYSSFWKKITDDGNNIRSAYGWQARFGHGFNQINHVIEQLRENDSTRQAIIHLHHATNQKYKDEICTLTIQFLVRNNQLHMIVNMRSNDIVLGLPYDHCLFLFIASYIANELKIELGSYTHNAGSLHLYNRHKLSNDIRNYDYLIKFSREFFTELMTVNEFELLARTNNIDIDDAMEALDEVEDDTSRAFIIILYLYNKKKMRHAIEDDFNSLINYVNCNSELLQLVKEYEGWY